MLVYEHKIYAQLRTQIKSKRGLEPGGEYTCDQSENGKAVIWFGYKEIEGAMHRKAYSYPGRSDVKVPVVVFERDKGIKPGDIVRITHYDDRAEIEVI